MYLRGYFRKESLRKRLVSIPKLNGSNGRRPRNEFATWLADEFARRGHEIPNGPRSETGPELIIIRH